MRESFRWVIIGLLTLCLVGMSCAMWQVRKTRASLQSIQREFEVQGILLRATESHLEEVERAYQALRELQKPTPPEPPTPGPPPAHSSRRRPIPTFSRDSQFVARPRRQWCRGF